ncbi:MAG: HD domain-containing protein [Lachnospiraceae bacterium]|nr:HD domain-containing protein [Lachnospiraceae bacterium]
MNIDRKRVLNAFKEYTDNYDPSDRKIMLKIDHTYNVAKISEKIAKSLDMDDYDTDLAWLLGMLHDIGRFEQVRRYDTFVDSKSVNHALLSADILFKDGLIKEFIDESDSDASELALIDRAVRFHNAFRLPENMSERELRFSRLLRDADKIDILRVMCEVPYEDPREVIGKERETAAISDSVYRSVIHCSNINRKDVKTSMDAYVTKISFVFDMVYPESFREIKRLGHLEKMMEYPSENPETRERLANIKTVVDKYIDEHIN